VTPRGNDAELSAELERLLVGTNDLRRRTGQAFHHFYRTLLFWQRHDEPFVASVRRWSASGAAIFGSMAPFLRRLGENARDDDLRRWVVAVVRQVADDVERGDHMVVPFLRWIEARFPPLTEMMKAERPDSRIYDADLAQSLAAGLAAVARTTQRAAVSAALRETAVRASP
jgi:hypothetical protein